MQYHYRFPGFRLKTLTFSYDDGVKQDRRLVEILHKNGLSGTFNLNGSTLGEEDDLAAPHGRLSRHTAQKVYNTPGMEVAVHTYTHPHLEWQPSATVMREVVEDRRALEELFGRPVTGMAYPFGTHAPHVVDVLRGAGIKYARTTVSTERFDMPGDWLRLPATCHHNNPRLMELADKFLALADNEKRRDWARLSMFYVWGHSYEFDDNDNWQIIEDFAAKMAGHDDIWYATNGEIYDYVRAIERLEISVDGRCCYNPSVIPVCFYANGRQYVAEPGKTLAVE